MSQLLEETDNQESGAEAMCFIQGKSQVGKTIDRDTEGREKAINVILSLKEKEKRV